MITEKELSTLNQLDRIEYRQKKNNLDEKFKGTVTNGVVLMGVILFIVLGIAELLLLELRGIHFISAKIFLECSEAFIGFLFFSLILDIILIYFGKKQRAKLDKEFFHFEIKPKEDKNGKGKRRGN